MAVPYYLIFHRTTIATELEWATKYHVAAGPHVAGRPEALAAAEAGLISDDVAFWRWEHWDSNGNKSAEGNFTQPLIGDDAGDIQPIKYCMLIRMNTAAIIERPSSRYIHGYTEALQTNGVINATGLAVVNAYGTDLVALGYVRDSDGQAITGVTFRSFTKRKRMRRIV